MLNLVRLKTQGSAEATSYVTKNLFLFSGDGLSLI